MQQIGYDACGRAVVYSDIGLALDHKASSNVEHCVQVLELLESFLPAYPYDQYVWVCDFHKFGAGNMSPSVATKCLSLFARSYASTARVSGGSTVALTGHAPSVQVLVPWFTKDPPTARWQTAQT